MVKRLQYPARAAQDPETLSEGQRDEIQWWQPFSEPIRQLAGVAAFAALIASGAAPLGDADDPPPPAAVTLDEHQPLSEPVLRVPTQHPAAFVVIDPTSLDAPLRDELQWFTEFSLPVLPGHQTRPGVFVTDPETLAEGLRDEIQWWRDFDLPPLSQHLVRSGITVIDTETLAEPLRDELQWFQPLSEPARRIAEAIGAGGVLEDITTGDDDPDTSWYASLSEPVLPSHLFQRAEASIIDPEALGEEGVAPVGAGTRRQRQIKSLTRSRRRRR
jgi:hypothetical protein